MSQMPELDLFSPAAKANPYPAFTLIRNGDPVFRLGQEGEQSTW